MGRLTPVVKNLLILNVGIFLIQMITGGLNSPVTYYLSLYDWRSEYFLPYQHLTHMFLHADLGHLFFNMLWLFFMGPMLESVFGEKRFLIFYLASGLGAGALHVGLHYFTVDPIYTQAINIPMLGASGAIAGVMAGVVFYFPNTEIILFPLPIPIKLKYFVLFYVGRELFNGIGSLQGQDSGVAHFAHLGGMLVGALIILYWKKGGSKL
jgi:membrane associated rhomboid family serine protease